MIINNLIHFKVCSHIVLLALSLFTDPLSFAYFYGVTKRKLQNVWLPLCLNKY
jgi:hypothetical protein